MAFKLHITNTAERELDKIFDYYLNEFSEVTAQKVIRGIRQSAELQLFTPDGALKFEDGVTEKLTEPDVLRYIISKNYLIFYVFISDVIYILHVLSSNSNFVPRLRRLLKNYDRENIV